jgi:hypothetical protein
MSDHVQVVGVQPVPAQNGKGTNGFAPCILDSLPKARRSDGRLHRAEMQADDLREAIPLE